MRLRKKLILYALTVSVIFIVEGYIALNSLEKTNRHTEHIYIEGTVPVNKINSIITMILAHRIKLFSHIGSNDIGETKSMEELRQEMKVLENKFMPMLKSTNTYGLSDEESTLFKTFSEKMQTILNDYEEILDLSESFSKEDAFMKAISENQNTFDSNLKLITEVLNMKRSAASRSFKDILEVKKFTWTVVFLSVSGAVIAILIITVLIIRSIMRSIKVTVDSISNTVNEISSVVDEYKLVTTQQASSVNETTTTMDELSASSRQTAEQVAMVAKETEQSMTLAVNGNDKMRQMLQEMSSLKNKVSAVAEQIHVLTEQTSDIEGVTNLVSDFARETKMLAMNAAVEAVRAGDYGKNFSVVAMEIRKLAEESKKSALTINDIVASIKQSTDSTVMAAEESTKTVYKEILIAEETAGSFSGIVKSINNANTSSQQISLNTKQQAEAVRQVVDTMNSINSGAKDVMSGIDRTNSIVQKLKEIAEKHRALM